jgi:hypothetical protein
MMREQKLTTESAEKDLRALRKADPFTAEHEPQRKLLSYGDSDGEIRSRQEFSSS